jgi:hypothetical protein
LVDNSGAIIASFTYSDAAPWPAGPDGGGATLVFTTRDPLTALATNGNNWHAHGRIHGNPGGPDATGYSSWAAAHNGSLNGTGDGDEDGVIDALEYLLGGDTAASSAPQLPAAGVQQFTVDNVPGDYLTLSYTRAPGTGDLLVVCETATDLNPANWAPNAIVVSREYNSDGTETYVFRAPDPVSAHPQQFMHLRVTLP